MLITDSPYPYRNLHAHVRRIYDAFGPERMMWGFGDACGLRVVDTPVGRLGTLIC